MTPMQSAANNPSDNVLPSGVTDQQLIDAVRTSGYPLQTIVASKLLPQFAITEEWSFSDRETGNLRALDVFAYRRLSDNTNKYQGVSPAVILLIECKRSDLPYVFFRSVTQQVLAEYPPVHGAFDANVDLRDKSTNIQKFPLSQVLGLTSESFTTAGPTIVSTFSRATRKSKAIELSGVDPFNTIIMPLVSAIDHSFNFYRPNRNPQPSLWFPSLVIPVCVLDAPMVVADSLSASLELQPWVRVIRQESKARSPERSLPQTTHYAVEIVHIGFFEKFVGDWILPLAEIFRQRIENRHHLLLNLSGHVQDFENWTWDEVT